MKALPEGVSRSVEGGATVPNKSGKYPAQARDGSTVAVKGPGVTGGGASTVGDHGGDTEGK